ncbi:hypothetical protein CaCOL14_010952 [Colletotrichum acutatum]|uniref:Heterokaryon incompatibility protein-domain-containing protein n=1 Tax=Glomerella acutata TaxID=27357 RepID=A0AAD8UGF6_GLOAC|nr:heterokaryon incompatibility protein-domain-containing protein [Colletotrichum acutatum]KAK1722658.1 heterokaryon incompatibility protein-domain-containing protein [Colletotrichum acutatum]
MCHQRVFIHEHCDCVWEKYSSLCEEHNTPGHTIEDWPVLVDKPCDVHPGGTPLSLAYFLRAAEFASLEDDDSSTDDTISSSNVQSDGTNESDDEPQVDVQKEQKRDRSATCDNSDHSLADEDAHRLHDDTSIPDQQLFADSLCISNATDDKTELLSGLQYFRYDGEKKTTQFIANAIKARNTEVTLSVDLGQSIKSVYQSLPVAADEIRVIKLQPAPSLLAPITAELVILKLGGGSSHYDALSYRWGDCLDPVNITMNGICMSVTQSLDTALRHLRHSKEERVVWADSVCINQEDMKEKSIQIQKMDEVYRDASCVRIWLGEAQGSTEAAMALLNSCAALNNKTEATQRVLEDDSGIRGLTELLLRPYWSRMWVFQEILLARRAEVHCGTLSADWWTVKTLDILTSNPTLCTVPETRVALVGNMRKAFMNIAHFNIPSSQPKSIENLLFPTSHLQASNDRDKLYALMGLCNIEAYLTVDYSKATRDIYMDFTRRYAERTGDLSLLYGAGLCQSESARGENIGLTSWIPDFRGIDGRDPFLLSAGLSKAFDASAGNRYTERRQDESEMDLRDDGLLVEALVVEKVVRTQSLDVSDSGRR